MVPCCHVTQRRDMNCFFEISVCSRPRKEFLAKNSILILSREFYGKTEEGSPPIEKPPESDRNVFQPKTGRH